ncbi:hypothetical protein [Streptomyces sp. AC555_RSS877]|uniref:hypothetical protein n=1 Tax=Streptomyces sp. AC555_RSS877 TaxID=2823688 RepID=UPI001C256D87|nr:hypothetical protein [Streptomyces sp. AC555_RSS877]
MTGTGLSIQEQALWDAFPTGQIVDLSQAAEPASANRRLVRASIISRLLLGDQEPRPGFVPSLRLRGATVTGLLDLSACEVPCSLFLQDCSFQQAPRLEAASLKLVDFSGSRFPSLELHDARVDGALRLNGCHSFRHVRLSRTTVTGTADLAGLHAAGTPAVLADSLTVDQDLILRDADISGEVLMWSARIGGTFVIEGTRITNSPGVTLNGDGLVVGNGLFGGTPGARTGHRFTSQGQLRLQDARISRCCTFSGSRLHNPHGTALNAERLHVDGPLALDAGFTAEGTVQLTGAHVQGSLLLREATLNTAGQPALNASLARISGDLNASSGVSIRGETLLEEAHIDGSADFTQAVLYNPAGASLSARRLHVRGRLYGGSLSSTGHIVLTDAQIGASLELPNAQLAHPGADTLTAWGMTVGGTVDCCDGFVSQGRMSFTNSAITSTLCLTSATITERLSFKSLRAGSMKTDAATTLRSAVDLRHAHIDVLADAPASWPDETSLDGLTYTYLETAPLDERLAWLGRPDSEYLPQPYEQLAAFYTRQGRDAEAREVLLARCRRHRSSQPPGLRIWGYLQDWAVGYGYRPIRAAAWLMILLTSATLAFMAQHPAAARPAEAPPFNAVLYALDLLLPVVDFGQQNAFHAAGWQQWLAAALIAAGWILATTIAAGITRTLSRR